MIDEGVLKAAEKLARAISKTPSTADSIVAQDATWRVVGGYSHQSAELIVQLANWAAPFLTEAENNLRQQHGGLLAALREQTSPHKNDTER